MQDIALMVTTATISIIIRAPVIVTFRTTVCTVISTFTVALLNYMACIAIDTFMPVSLGSTDP